MTLFSPGERTNLRSQLHAEPAFSYLDISGRTPAQCIRETLDSWFGRYANGASDPQTERTQLRSSFRDTDDRQHFAAFWELLLHELFLRLGFEVEVHPELDWTTKRPDFLMRWGEQAFIVEAICVTAQDKRDRSAETRLAVVEDQINSWHFERFWLSVEYSGPPPASPPIERELRPLVERYLGRMAPDALEQRLQQKPDLSIIESLVYSWNDWTLTIRALPKPAGLTRAQSGGAIGIAGQDAAILCQAAAFFQRAVLKKARLYGKPPVPYYIAVNTLEPGFDPDDYLTALFGRSVVEIVETPSGTKASAPQRGTNGALIRYSKPNYTRVAGVLCANLLPWTLGKDAVTLYPHPYYPGEAIAHPNLNRLPSCRCVSGQFRSVAGESLRTLLELEDGWPHFDQE